MARSLSKGWATMEGKRLPQPRRSLAQGNAALEKKATDLVDHCRTLTDQAAADAMQRLQIEVIAAVQWHEAHGWPLRRFRDGLHRDSHSCAL